MKEQLRERAEKETDPQVKEFNEKIRGALMFGNLIINFTYLGLVLSKAAILVERLKNSASYSVGSMQTYAKSDIKSSKEVGNAKELSIVIIPFNPNIPNNTEDYAKKTFGQNWKS